MDGKEVGNRRRIYKMEQMRCWPQVLAMFENGIQLSVIAKFIQEESGECTDIHRASVERSLRYWLKKNWERPDIIDRAPLRHVSLIESASDRIDPVDALNMLFAIQVDRISDHYSAEKRSKNFTNFNNGAIRLAKDIAEAMADIERVRRPGGSAAPMSGEGKAAVETFNQTQRLKKFYEDKFGGVAAAVLLNDESRRKIISALDKVRKGNSDSLADILKTNSEKASELRAAEVERIREEGQTIDVEVKASNEG